MRRRRSFTPGNRPGPRPTSTASSTARTARPSHHHYAWWIAPPLDLAAMAGAAAALPGEHDFTAFRASGSDNRNPVRRVLAAAWRDRARRLARFTITATGFLRGMVRSLVGTMVEVGQGQSAADHAGGVAGEPAPATWPAPPRRPRGFIWWKCFMESEQSAVQAVRFQPPKD